MVRYYGRARQRIGSVNTNQLGLKMSGCPSKIGKNASLLRYQSNRVKCNLKACGPVYRHGVIWGFNSINCVKKAPPTQSFNSGVGTINTSRFNCSSSCKSEMSIEQAIKLIHTYFKKFNLIPALFAKKETLLTDLNHPISKKLGSITHYETGSSNFRLLPSNIQYAISIINNFKITGDVEGLGQNLQHSIATINKVGFYDLIKNNYGKFIIMTNLHNKYFGFMAFESIDCNSRDLQCIDCNSGDLQCIDCNRGDGIFTLETICLGPPDSLEYHDTKCKQIAQCLFGRDYNCSDLCKIMHFS